MPKSVELHEDAERLRNSLHQRIDAMSQPRLSILNQVLLQLEAVELAERLDVAFDKDRQEGRISKERISKVIEEVRTARPYE